MSDLKKFDTWLTDTGPAALVIREFLQPVEGPDGILFPPTFAASEDKTFKGGYNIDTFSSEFEAKMKWEGEKKQGDYSVKFADHRGEHNVCLVDSVGSQANRIEPLFASEKYAGLIPQITVKAGEKAINILEAGHRAGDAIVRCTSLQKSLQEAFKFVQRGNAESLAKIAPTSLVFGVWDSRDTQAKLPRLISSTIRAFDVQRLTRSAQFNPATEYINDGLLEDTTDKAAREEYSKRGFIHVPASGSHGGIIATTIRRDATLSLAALRLLNVEKDKTKTEALRRYILGLALVAFTYRPSSYLRQGCNLVPDTDKPAELTLVQNEGTRTSFKLTHDEALAYAQAAAKAFGVGESHEVEFDKNLAKQDVAGDDTKPAKGKKK